MIKVSLIKKFVAIVAWPLMLSFLVVHLSADPGRSKVDIDEVYWVGQSYYFNLAFVQNDLTNPQWQLHTAREHPPLGKYIVGATLALSGKPVSDMDLLGLFYLKFKNRPKAWGSGEDYQKRLAITQYVQPERVAEWERNRKINPDKIQIRNARLLMLVFGILTAIAIYIVGFQIRGFICGVVASAVFAVHPISIRVYSHAHMDIITIFFAVLSVACFILVQKRSEGEEKSSEFTNMFLILVGAISVAFACGSKMSGTIAALVGVVLCLHHLVFVEPKSRRNFVIRSYSLILVGSFLIFWALNPSMYPDPLHGMWAHITEHGGVVKVQVEMGLKPLVGIYSKWRAISTALMPHSLLLPLVILIAIYYSFHSIKKDRLLMICCFWWWIAFACTIAWIPFSWSRYVVILVPPLALLIGTASSHLAAKAGRIAIRNFPMMT